MMKRNLTVLLAVVLGVSLLSWGCEKKEPGPAAPAASPAPAPTPAPTKSAPAPKKAAAAPADMQPLKIELPAPMFAGTPRPVNEPNIEKPSGKPRPPFLAPAGTVNLALGKPVTGSDEWPVIGDLEMVTDGDKSGGQGSFVELAPGVQWVQIDLQKPSTIYAILMWHYHAQARAYRDVIVQVSDDPEFLTGVKTVFNNDHDNSAGLGAGKDMGYVETFEGKLIDCKGVVGRYVRLYSNGNTSDDGNHYVEVEVYGKPAP